MAAEFGFLDLIGLRLGEAFNALLALPVVLHQHAFAGRIHHAIGVDAEAILMPVAGGDAARAHNPGDHVHGFRAGGPEIEDPVRHLPIVVDRIGFLAVDEIGELGGIADKEHRQVVAHQVPVAIFGAEFHCESARIAGNFRAIATTGHGAESHTYRCDLAFFLEQLGAGVRAGWFIANGAVRLENAVGGHAAGMHHALRHALAIEVAHFFEEMVVLHRRRAAITDRAQLLVVMNGVTLTGGEYWFAVIGHGMPPLKSVTMSDAADAGEPTGLLCSVSGGCGALSRMILN